MSNARQIAGSRWAVYCLVVAGLCSLAEAQTERRWEVGAQAVVADFRGLGEVPGGFGARCLYHLNDYLALDGEVDYFPASSRRGSSRLSGIRSEITWPQARPRC